MHAIFLKTITHLTARSFSSMQLEWSKSALKLAIFWYTVQDEFILPKKERRWKNATSLLTLC